LPPRSNIGAAAPLRRWAALRARLSAPPPSRYPRDVQSLGSETDELTALCCFTFFETEGKLGVFLSDRLRGWIRGVIPPRWIRRSPPAAQEADPWDRTTMPLGIATYAPWDGQWWECQHIRAARSPRTVVPARRQCVNRTLSKNGGLCQARIHSWQAGSLPSSNETYPLRRMRPRKRQSHEPFCKWRNGNARWVRPQHRPHMQRPGKGSFQWA